MHQRDLDRLLDGAAGATMIMQSGERVHFTRHELRSPVAWRAAIRRQMGHTGWVPPVYDQADHDRLVRVMFRLIDAEASEAAALRS